MAVFNYHLRSARLLFFRVRESVDHLLPNFHSVRLRYCTNPVNTNVRKTFSHIFQECSNQRAVDPGKQAHARMLVSGFQPTIFVTNCLIQLYIKCSNLEYANMVFDKMPQPDTVSWNAMINGHAKSGDMAMAQWMFDSMPDRDIISWNSLISGYLQNGNHCKSVSFFSQMVKESVTLDQTTFAVVLKASLVLEDYDLAIQIHGKVVRLGFNLDVVTGSAIVDMYAKCKKLKDSIQFFNEMPEKNWVSWSALIAGCVHNAEHLSGLELFKQMQKEGVGVSQSTYASVFRSCAGLSALRLGSQLHAHALKRNFGYDIIVGTATLDMYAKCDDLSNAKKLFESLANRSLQSHNAIIVGCARGEQGFEALQIFRLLLRSGLGFDEISLSGVFRACAIIKGYLEGIQVHGLAVKSRFRSNVCVTNAVIDMYGKCGALFEARSVFDEMERTDAVSWNTIIAAYEQNNKDEETISLISWMVHSGMEPDDFTYGSVLKACAAQQALKSGMEIHGRITKSWMGLDSFIGSALVDMYCKCSKIEQAEKIHCRMEEQTMVSWNSIISGFSNQEKSEEAQKLFSWMMENGVKPDNFTYATILDTCANLATVGLGKQIHAQIIKQEMNSDTFIASTLVDMYSKCGNMLDSKLIFEKARKRDFVTWNAMICGYAQHGLAEEALLIFEAMQMENVKPNHATFVSVLRACAHMGLHDKGLHYFYKMKSEYNLDPQLEHYACMVDILGRSGKVNKAVKLIEEMPMEADEVIWRTLLSTCKVHGDVQTAEIAASSLLKMDPRDSSAYILLSNIYADAGMWDQVSEMRKIMRYSGLKKEPGCSWIEVKSELHMFLIREKAHPKCSEIYDILDVLIDDLKLAGYSPHHEYVMLHDDEITYMQQETCF